MARDSISVYPLSICYKYIYIIIIQNSDVHNHSSHFGLPILDSMKRNLLNQLLQMQQAKVCIATESNKAVDVQATVWMNFWISGESGA